MIRVGEAAWLLELADSAQVLAAHRTVCTWDEPGIADVIPGAATLLVVGSAAGNLDAERLRDLERTAQILARDAGPAAAPRTHEIVVRYDGEDLPELAQRAGRTVAEVVARHAGAAYRVAFVGFQPGFAYLDGLPRELHAPRRATPRARVPAGSVAIGGAWTGVYPLAGPGGWNLLGTTDRVLFDAAKEPPALLQPGDVVRFVAR